MSFGYSVGDCLAVIQLAWKVYKSCKDAPESFSNIQFEVLSLHAVLKEVEETLPEQQFAKSRQQRLATISNGCEHVLNDLQAFIEKYQSLGSNSKRTWDRMRWGSTEVAELRARLTSNTMLLTAFLSTSQITVERQLNKLIQEFQEGKHEGSVLTVATIESISVDEKETWRLVRKELETIGISIAAFEANKSFIMNWFRQALESGAFEEQGLPNDQNVELEVYEGTQPELHRGSTTDQELQPVRSRNFSSESSHTSVHEIDDTTRVEERNAAKGLVPDQPKPILSAPSTSTRAQKPVVFSNEASGRKRPPRVAIIISWMLRHDKALHEACQDCDYEGAEVLLEKGANINSIFEKHTPLTNAASTLDISMVRFLWEAGADINYTNGYRCTALMAAIQARPLASLSELRLVVIEYLLQHGAKIDGSDLAPRKPSEWAMILQDTKVIGLLVKYGQLVHDEGWMRGTPLHAAVTLCSVAVVNCLLDHGVNVDANNASWGRLWNTAMVVRRDDIASLLIQKRANVTEKPLMFNPIECAATHNCPKTLELLISMFPGELSKKEFRASSLSPLIYRILRRKGARMY